MDTTRLSSKGQVIIPKAVRDAHGWGEGLEFAIEDLGDAIVLRPAKVFPVRTIDEVVGMLKYVGTPKTKEDMNAGIDEAMREIWDRKSK
jgi:AbrB family looped-hinge helix DNA binding protein